MSFPTEDLFAIALKLPIKDLLNLCSSSSQYASLCADDYLWKLLSERDYGVTSLPYYAGSWKQYYIQAYTDANNFYYIEEFYVVSEGENYSDVINEYREEFSLLQEASSDLFFEPMGDNFSDYIKLAEYGFATFIFPLRAKYTGLTVTDMEDYAEILSKKLKQKVVWGVFKD